MWVTTRRGGIENQGMYLDIHVLRNASPPVVLSSQVLKLLFKGEENSRRHHIMGQVNRDK